MKRYKRLYILLAVLVVACGVTFAVSRIQEHRELVRTSDEIILELPTDSVTAVSWTYEDETLAFHRGETSWLYDEDETFPVDGEKLEEMLSRFAAFGVAFVIEDVEDFGQYGLDDPVCTIDITADEQTYEITLGDFSALDEQRYVSIGDGHVYLVQTDPLDDFDAQLSDMIDNDEIPAFDTVTALTFTGEDSYAVSMEEDGESYREADIYFTETEDGAVLPLDTGKVEDYLDALEGLTLDEYVSYNAGEADLSAWGLDAPALTVTVDYLDENEEAGSFTLQIGVEPQEETEAGDTEPEAAEGEDPEATAEPEEEEEVTAYARVGESGIIYQLLDSDQQALMAAGRDDLRHAEVIPAEFEDIAQITVSLEGETYEVMAETDGEDEDSETVYTYAGEELDIAALRSALNALEAESFTDESPTEKEEISLTLRLNLEGDPEVRIQLYRYDGSNCLAVVDGTPLALVPRSQVVDLIEAVNAFALNGNENGNENE